MTPCDRLRRALAAGDQTLLADPSLRAHFAVCPTCAPALAADQALRRALAALSRPPLSPALERRLRAVSEGASSRAEPSAGRQAAPPVTGDASLDSGAPRHATRLAARGSGRRERAVAALLLAACLAGLAFALGRLRPTPADFDATPPAPPTTLTRLPGESSPTPWSTPRPPLPPLPRIPDEGLALPEGALVVVADEAGLLLFEGAAKGRRLVEGPVGGFKISPDGRWVAYEAITREEPLPKSGLWVVGTGTGRPRPIVNAAEVERLAPVPPADSEISRAAIAGDRWGWTPDSGALIFGTFQQFLDEPYSAISRDDLWKKSLAGGDAAQLMVPGQGGRFSFSPDGSRMVIIRVGLDDDRIINNLAIASSTGRDWRELLRMAPLRTGSEWIVYPKPQWSADGQTLLLALTRPAPSREGWADPEAPTPLIRLAMDGSYRTVGPMVVLGRRDEYNGLWSSDGRSVAYFQSLTTPAPLASPQATRAALASYGTDLEGYPSPQSPGQGAAQARLVITDLDLGASVAYDWVSEQSSRMCWSPSGRRFAYEVDQRVWRLGHREEAPRLLDLPMDGCRWADDDLLLTEDGRTLQLLRLDGLQRTLWQTDQDGQKPRIELFLPATPPAPPTAIGMATSTATTTTRLFASPPLLTAAHVGSIGFVGDGAWAQVMAWDEEDLLVAEPPQPLAGRRGDWPKGRLVALDLAGGRACHLVEAAGPPVPERRDEAFARTAWLAEHGGPQVLAVKGRATDHTRGRVNGPHFRAERQGAGGQRHWIVLHPGANGPGPGRAAAATRPPAPQPLHPPLLGRLRPGRPAADRGAALSGPPLLDSAPSVVYRHFTMNRLPPDAPLPACCPPPDQQPDLRPVEGAEADEELAALAKALGHPARLRILRLLVRRESCVCGDIVDELPLAQSTVSQHLKVLKDAGLIRGEVDGPRMAYCLQPRTLRRLKALVGGL